MEFEGLNGYTHIIRYEKFVPSIGVYVPSHFRTTEDAIKIHVRKLEKDANIKNIVIEEI